MTLSIVITNDEWIQEVEPSIFPANLAIAGKTVLKYWIEWAKINKYVQLDIYSTQPKLEDMGKQSLEELYNIKINSKQIKDYKEIPTVENLYYGFGIFLEDGNLFKITGIQTLLSIESKILVKPFSYSSQIGYGNNPNIQIGRNVYIHKSVKIMEPVIIGDNCIIEANIILNNSVINSGVHIKQGSVLKNSRISKHQNLNTDIYLDNKALFSAKIYDIKECKIYSNGDLSHNTETKISS